MRAAFVGMPESVRRALEPFPPDFRLLKTPSWEMDYLHYFAESVADLEAKFDPLKRALAKTGMLWISWRKGRKSPELTENDVRQIAIERGLVDVKVCAVDETWSGLKLVYRVKDR